MDYPFQIFGSPDSTDRDVVVFLPELPDSIAGRSGKCKEIAPALEALLFHHQYPAIPLNLNLPRLDSGLIREVFKGTPDELNNACFLTYSHFPQLYSPMVTGLLPRDLPLKLDRALRTILSVLSRTQYRMEVKAAVNEDTPAKKEALGRIDFSRAMDFGHKSMPPAEVWKTIAFQMGQTLALYEGRELFTKAEIYQCFPELTGFLRREKGNFEELEALKKRLLNLNEGLGK